ncbi:MAG: CHRD domain-containing protein [Phycisphaerales bacterium]|nr:CHRD domain-containing protein [Phycisphaerales bacterium]
MKTLFAAALSLGCAAAAGAVTWTIALTGAEEVPPVITNATGAAKVKFNPNTNFVKVTGSYENLSSAATVGHLHGLSGAGFTSPPIVHFMLTGGTTGTFAGEGFLTPAQGAGLLNGLTYVNIHSVNFAPGEIRGQVVPAPGASALLGALALGALRRRR